MTTRQKKRVGSSVCYSDYDSDDAAGGVGTDLI